MSSKNEMSFFSISIDQIEANKKIGFDLYVNASSKISKERFVRIFPFGDMLAPGDISNFEKKYPQLYVSEEQRNLFLQALVKSKNFSLERKAKVIKDFAIFHLEKIVHGQNRFSSQFLQDVLKGCQDVVDSLLEVIQDKSIMQIQDLISSLSFHDMYTYDHSVNVSMYCISIFKSLVPDAPRDKLVSVGMAGLLHDLGKLIIPTSIINNPGKLSDEEFQKIRTHPKAGKDMLEDPSIKCSDIDLDLIKRVAMEHHENFNGTGYPRKLSGDQIHPLSKIAAIADFYDAITTQRSYHKVMNTDEAISVMAGSSGIKLDPKLFKIFVKKLNRVVKTRSATVVMSQEFDPCQPHNVLPFKKVDPKYKIDNFTGDKQDDFGKVKKESPIFDDIADKKKAS